jgi:hypothetical protein
MHAGYFCLTSVQELVDGSTWLMNATNTLSTFIGSERNCVRIHRNGSSFTLTGHLGDGYPPEDCPTSATDGDVLESGPSSPFIGDGCNARASGAAAVGGAGGVVVALAAAVIAAAAGPWWSGWAS